MATPGTADIHQAWRSTLRDEPIMKPQLMRLGSPSPRKERPDSSSTAVATISEPVTITGPAALGKICRKMMARSAIPSASQARTNSRWRRAMNSPRTSRATAGHETMAMAATMLRRLGWKMATSTTAKMKDGMVWKNSVSRISASSTQPPR